MNTNNTPRHHALTIAIHWIMLLMFLTVYASIELRGIFPKGSTERSLMMSAHIGLGFCIFALTWMRLAARALFKSPAPEPSANAWEPRLAQIVHISLYVLMIAMPLLGWLMLSANGRAIAPFGIALPALIAPDKSLGHLFKEAHEIIGRLGYALIGAHAGAALFHHYLRKDSVLTRMAPWIKR